MSYIYLEYLLHLDWRDFGQPRTTRRLLDSLDDMDTAFALLGKYTFSEAMLTKIPLYMLIGVPVAVVLLVLERDRVRWLQQRVTGTLPAEEAQRTVHRLEAYLRLVIAMLGCILALGPLHLELPWLHYPCALLAILCGFCALGVQLSLPVSASGLSPRARSTVGLIFAFHFAALAAGHWKASGLGDDVRALCFGVVETLLVLLYQLWMALYTTEELQMYEAVSDEHAEDLNANKPSCKADIPETLLGS